VWYSDWLCPGSVYLFEGLSDAIILGCNHLPAEVASNTAHNILDGLSGFKGVYIVTVVGHPAFSLMTLLSQKYTA
jgi:hypothetical protein